LYVWKFYNIRFANDFVSLSDSIRHILQKFLSHFKKFSEHIHLKLTPYILLPRNTTVNIMENIFYIISQTVILLLVMLTTRTLKNVGTGEYKLKLILMCELKRLRLYKLHACNTAIKRTRKKRGWAARLAMGLRLSRKIM